MFPESICPVRKKIEMIIHLENWMPIELCESCIGEIVFSYLQKSYSLKTSVYLLVSELYQDREQGSEG